MEKKMSNFLSSTSTYRSAIMGLAMLSIMLFHQYFTSSIPFNVFHNFGFWGVDVFLFLSGMGLVMSLNNNSLKVYYSHRFNRIIPSCILCGSLKYIIALLIGSSVAILNINMWSIMSLDLWFIHAIIILYTISPLLYYSLNKWTYITIAFVLFVFFLNGIFVRPQVGFEWQSPIGVFAWTTERLPVFGAGMLIAIRKNWIDEKIRYSFPFLIVAIGLNLLEKVGTTFSGIQACQSFALMIGMPSLITLCITAIKIIPKRVQQVISFFGIYSLELYLVHESIFWTLIIKYNDSNPFVMLVLGFTIACFSAFLCKSITKNIKIL